MASEPRNEEEEDEYELTLLGRVVIPLGALLVRLDGGPEPSDFRGWSALVGRLVGRYRVLVLGTVAAVVVAAAVAVYFVTRTTPPPSTTAAARLVLDGSRGHAPAAANGDYLAVSYSGVKFPNYQAMHAVATGQLSKAVDGRPAMTVFYRLLGGQRLSYTVFSGAPTDPPARARLEYFSAGVGLRIYHAQGLNVITAVRHGRTTVLASTAPVHTILTFAAAPILKETTQSNSGCAACG